MPAKTSSTPREGCCLYFIYSIHFFAKKSFNFVVFRGWVASNMQNSFTKIRTKRSENDLNKTKMNTLENQFAQMVSQHKSTIYTVCFMFSKQKEEVDDLFQEVLCNLWRGYSSFRGESNVATWVWRVAFNTCISTDRKRRRSNSIPLSMNINLFEDKDDDSRQIKMLYDRIRRLKPFDRAIVLLWLENMSYEEIAAIVGITVKNVSVRLYRIKEELKQMSNE